MFRSLLNHETLFECSRPWAGLRAFDRTPRRSGARNALRRRACGAFWGRGFVAGLPARPALRILRAREKGRVA